MRFAVFDYEIALKSPLANETPSSTRARKRKNIECLVGFIDNRDVDATLTISSKSSSI